MAIINLTDDSFYSGSRVMDPNELVDRVGRMLEEGASVIDIGAMSTRPRSLEIDIDVEITRIYEATNLLVRHFPSIIISIDTYRSSVARAGLEAGAHIINDVGGGLFDEKIWDVVAEFKAPYILMHNRAKSAEMHRFQHYEDIISEVMSEWLFRAGQAREHGVRDILFDPGIGFSKDAHANFKLLNRLHEFRILEYPMLIGLSRKRFIYQTLAQSEDLALNGTTAMHMVALMSGANILRVHDVKPAVQCVQLYNEMKA